MTKTVISKAERTKGFISFLDLCYDFLAILHISKTNHIMTSVFFF